MEDLAKTAGMAKARGEMSSKWPNAAHIDTSAYGLHAVKNPIHTATLNFRKTEKDHERDAMKNLMRTIMRSFYNIGGVYMYVGQLLAAFPDFFFKESF